MPKLFHLFSLLVLTGIVSPFLRQSLTLRSIISFYSNLFHVASTLAIPYIASCNSELNFCNMFEELYTFCSLPFVHLKIWNHDCNITIGSDTVRCNCFARSCWSVFFFFFLQRCLLLDNISVVLYYNMLIGCCWYETYRIILEVSLCAFEIYDFRLLPHIIPCSM